MGRLVGLELCNFKSYRGTVKVGFGDSNFVSIIGPNGSGKSNMMDAISFVLGVKSSHLRSNLLKDLIYRGVEGEDEDEEDTEKQGRSAYVKAFYLKGDSTVELLRSISKNGDTTYKINSKNVSYKHYAAFLEEENILIKAQNFLVFQGDVVQIASQSTTDLTRLFEEVSGSIQYKKEYDILKEKVDSLSQSAAESIKNRRRIHGELKSYKEGIDKNQEFYRQVEKRKEFQRHYALWQLYHLEQQREEYLRKLQELKGSIKTARAKETSQGQILQRSKSSVAKESTAILKQRNKLEHRIKEKEKVNTELLPLRLSQRAAEKRITNVQKRIDSLQRDINRQSEYVERFENQLKVVTKTKTDFEAEIKNSAKNYDKYQLNDEDAKLYASLNEKYLNEGGFDLESKMNMVQNDKQEVLEQVQQMQKRIEMSKFRIADELEVTKEKLESQIAETSSWLNEKNSLHSEKVKELQNLHSVMESSSNKEYDLNYRLREALMKIEDLSANQRETARERKLRENVANLKRFFPGVKGLICDLCQPKKEKYALAVSTILGKNFDSVVVDNVVVAQECIAYLKKQRAGIASFIPLDTIDIEVPSLNLSEEGCALTINAIDYEPEFERALQYVCTDSIICENLDIAKDLKWNKGVKSKLVTLEGALIHKAGLMTGGVSRNSGNRWDKEEYQSLMSLKDKLLAQVDEASAQGRKASIMARELESSLSLLNAEISDLRTQMTLTNRALKENKVEMEYHQKLIAEEYGPKLQILKEKSQSYTTSLQKLESQKEELQNRIFQEFSDHVGFTVKDYESHTGEMMRQQTKQLQQLQREILNVENKLQFERDRLKTTERRCEKAQQDVAKYKIELSKLQEQETETERRIQEIDQDITAQSSELQETQKKLDAKQSDIDATEDVMHDVTANLQVLKRRKDELKEEVEKVDMEKVCVLKNCKLSNILIPIASETNLDSLPIDKIDEETLAIANKIQVDFQQLPAKYKESGAETIRDELEQAIKHAGQALDSLQPNSKATERYDEAQDRFEAINSETEKLKSEEKKVISQFLKIKKKRKALFERAFDYVSEHIDGVYRELTKNPGSTNELAGGSASLTLEDEDEPFNAGIRYHATPPFKRFKDIEYLSGGEKTVAALALLFTINSFQPSPFFVLDEVDAALDSTNVDRIAAYITRHGNHNLQFIVISLKNTMFEKSDALVGVYRHQQENSSKIVTLNLKNYAN
ncbi:probable Structural maintenance of chromosomes protein 1 [Zygosaccharomyces bailii]|nr:probable Structural maintenance of chromosomes protein 1 [Zygosaccharomyces bailii]